MPVTPFHFGPGLFIKAALPARVSFSAFCFANVLIDLESGWNLITRQYPVHATAHTFIVAAVIGFIASGCVIWSRRFVPGRLTKALHAWPRIRDAFDSETSVRPAILGGLLGGLTHPFFDGIMHRDIRPFLPFTDANPLLAVIPVGMLHKYCIAAGLLGAIVLAARMLLRRTAS